MLEALGVYLKLKNADKENSVNEEKLIPVSVLKKVMNELPEKGAKGVAVENDLAMQEMVVSSIRSRAKLSIIENKKKTLSDDESYFALASHFEENNVVTMTFEAFKDQRELAPASIKRFFTSANFLFFPRNASGSISAYDFLR